MGRKLKRIFFPDSSKREFVPILRVNVQTGEILIDRIQETIEKGCLVRTPSDSQGLVNAKL